MDDNVFVSLTIEGLKMNFYENNYIKIPIKKKVITCNLSI